MADNTKDLYRINDFLTSLASEFGVFVDEDTLNDLTHEVYGTLGIWRTDKYKADVKFARVLTEGAWENKEYVRGIAELLCMKNGLPDEYKDMVISDLTIEHGE